MAMTQDNTTNEELLTVCMELRDALAGAMRVIASQDVSLTEAFIEEMRAMGIKNGIGVRADVVIAKAGAQ